MERITIPRILECYRLISKESNKGNHISRRIVKDYELDFYIDGHRWMKIDQKEYAITAGTLVFRKPGQAIESTGEYNCYIMTLDLSERPEFSSGQYIRTHPFAFQKATDHVLFDEFPSVFIPKHFEEIKELYKKIDANTYPFPEDSDKINAYMKELLFIISADIASLKNIDEKKSQAEEYIQKVYKYINKNYMKDIKIKELAKEISVNQNYLIRIFKEKTNLTPNQYLNDVRLFHARQMLTETSYKNYEIAFACGFNNPSYFSECFKKKFSLTPSGYRKSKDHS